MHDLILPLSVIVERVEMRLLEDGLKVICGCDEAGRGPLAGPVVGAAVVFSDCETLWQCKDSKSLSEARREALASEIRQNLLCAVSVVEPAVIDRVNIRVASLQAMSEAVTMLGVSPDVVFVDGRDRLPQISSHAVIRGDSRIATISAASILAKVARDEIMRTYHTEYPVFGFDRHFGYPTAEHRAAIRLHGPCAIHRKTFRGVQEYLR